jgi:hypothetical protein
MPNIRVSVRVRPLSVRELARDSHPCIKVQEGTQVRCPAAWPIKCCSNTGKAPQAFVDPAPHDKA